MCCTRDTFCPRIEEAGKISCRENMPHPSGLSHSFLLRPAHFHCRRAPFILNLKYHLFHEVALWVQLQVRATKALPRGPPLTRSLHPNKSPDVLGAPLKGSVWFSLDLLIIQGDSITYVIIFHGIEMRWARVKVARQNRITCSPSIHPFPTKLYCQVIHLQLRPRVIQARFYVRQKLHLELLKNMDVNLCRHCMDGKQ